jgi:hypothetical protein
MITKLAFALTAAVALATISWQAQATPLAAAKQIYQSKNITLVGGVCGPGWHWSKYYGRCVPN